MSWAVPETQDQCMFSCVKSGYDESARFFNEWVEEVKRAVPPEKLLIFEVKEGWAPLCKFLGVPEPTIPFPRVNDTASMQRKIWWAQVAAWGIVVVLPMLVAAAMIVVLTTTLS